MRKIFSIIVCLGTISCAQQNLKYESILKFELGTNANQIGSNIPILQKFQKKDDLASSFFYNFPPMIINHNNVYFADMYNKRISVFSLNNKNVDAELIISNKGTDYEFSRPYLIHVDKEKNIYVLASIEDIESFEVQNYTNVLPEASEYKKFQEKQLEIPIENFVLYKFSSRGKFISQIGASMKKPQSIQSDGDHIYIYYPEFNSNENYITVKRYHKESGIMNWSKNLNELNITTNISETNYTGKILSVQNSLLGDKLFFLQEFQPSTGIVSRTNKNKVTTSEEDILASSENIWTSIFSYSLEDESIQELYSYKGITSDILGVDENDRIFLQNYNEEQNNIKITILNNNNNRINISYVPIHSLYYSMNGYIINFDGDLFSSIIDKEKFYQVLKWNHNL